MEECKYCHDYTQKIKGKSLFKTESWFSLYEGFMEVVDDREDGNIITFKIEYCPMCGRKIGG